jgi:hypothetical protein
LLQDFPQIRFPADYAGFSRRFSQIPPQIFADFARSAEESAQSAGNFFTRTTNDSSQSGKEICENLRRNLRNLRETPQGTKNDMGHHRQSGDDPCLMFGSTKVLRS